MFFFYGESDGGAVASWTEIQKLTTSYSMDYTEFGIDISFGQGVMVVGARSEQVDGVSGAGAVHINEKQNDSWVEIGRLIASNKAQGDYFGHRVCIDESNSIIAVSSPYRDSAGSNAGAAYVFEKQGENWVETQMLTASDKEANDQFGYGFAMNKDGTVIAIGAHNEDPDGVTNAGVVYIFEKQNSFWTQIQKLSASDKAENNRFGMDLSINGVGDVLVIGSSSTGGTIGSSYIFQKQNNTWQQTAILEPSSPVTSGYFGGSVSINQSGNMVAIGHPGFDSAGLDRNGAIVIFENQNNIWVETAVLESNDPANYDGLGWSVIINADGNIVIAGSMSADPDGVTNAGAVYVFQKTGDSWVQTQKLVASDKQAFDEAGTAIAISRDNSTIAFSAPKDDSLADNSGAVYIFQGT